MTDVTMQECVDLSGDGGVLKEIYQEGSGEYPPAGDEIRGALFCLWLFVYPLGS